MRAFLGIAFAVALPFSASDRAELFGRVLDPVACEAEPSQRYALYVPSSYTSGKKWPVIFCFDASARGRMPVERLQAAAEKYGYLVAGSLNSRNGPYAENAVAVQAMMKDVSSHFSVDARRVYTTGVSGGARLATAIALSGVAKGVIACAAGFPVLPEGIPLPIAFVFFGTTGTEDFNHGEMRRLDGELEERKAVHRIVVFNGGHEWAPAALFTEAVEWLELQAMRAGTRPRDDEFVRAQFHARLAAVPAPPGLERWRALKSLIADFESLADTAQWAKNAQELGASREVKAELKAERALFAREEELLSDLGNAALESTARKQKRAAELRAKADGPGDSPERRLVRRVIASFSSMTRETLKGLFDQENYDQAAGFMEMAAALRPDQKGNWFDLARARALNGERSRALDALEQAIVAGFGDTARVETEPAFAKLRATARFQAVLGKLRAPAPETATLLPPMRVSAALASVELRLFYLPNAGGGVSTLSFLAVETVRANTRAAQAGLREGMELVAIQNVRIRGLSEEDLEKLMALPVRNEIGLIVREAHGDTEQALRIPLRK